MVQSDSASHERDNIGVDLSEPYGKRTKIEGGIQHVELARCRGAEDTQRLAVETWGNSRLLADNGHDAPESRVESVADICSGERWYADGGMPLVMLLIGGRP